MNKLSIRKVLKDSFRTYKSNWGTLLLISLFLVLISFSAEIIGPVIDASDFQSVGFLSIIIGFSLRIIRVYLVMRLTVSLILVAHETIANREIHFLDAFMKAKSLTFRYFGFSLIIGVMMSLASIPLIIAIFFGQILNTGGLLNIVLFILGIALPTYLGTIFYFSLISSVIYPNESDIFTYSKKLVKGNFFRVLVLLSISITAIFGNIVYIYLVETIRLSAFFELAISLISKIPNVLLMPFTMIVSLEAMKQLEGIHQKEKDLVS